MTVSSTPRKVGQFNGNDVTTAFPFAVKVFEAADIEWTVTDADGVETLLVLDSDFSVSLNADQDSDPGGTMTYPLSGDPLATGETLVGLGAMVADQQTDLVNLGRFLPQVHENAFDKLTILIQQLVEKFTRAIVTPVGDTANTVLPTAANRAGKALVFDEDGGVTVGTREELNAIDASVAAAAASAAAAATAKTNAETAETNAELAETNAETAESNAENAQGAAETAQAAAEAASDTAFTNANVYANTADGLAAVALGGQFTVVDGNEAVRYREDSGPVATEVARFPTATLVRKLAIAGGVKRYSSLIPLDALASNAFNVNLAAFGKIVTQVDPTDMVYRGLGIKYEFPGAEIVGQQIRTADLVALLVGKWVTVGYVARDAGGVAPVNTILVRTANNKSGSGAVIHTPAAGNRRSIALDATHWLVYAQLLMPASTDGMYVFFADSGFTSATDAITAPFIVVTDGQPSIYDIEIFPGESGRAFAEATAPDQLFDELGSEQPINFTYVGPVTAVTLDAAKEIIPSGSAVQLDPSSTQNASATLVFPSAAGREGQYIYGSIYLVSESGSFTGAGITFFLRNGDTNVNITTLDDNIRVTPIGTTIRRYDFVGQFREAWATHGLSVRCLRAIDAGPPHPVYIFGFMAAVHPDRRLGDYIQPKVWVPKNEPVRGWQLTSAIATPASTWAGKKLVWIGHSIPEFADYPIAVGSALGVGEMVDIVQGGGHICSHLLSGAMQTQSLMHFMFTLEAADVTAWAGANLGMEVTATNYSVLQPGSGVVLTQAMLDELVEFNYVNRLVPHYDSDLFIFDYGVNDSANLGTLAADAGYDRKHFAGAVKYLWKKIYDYKTGLGQTFNAVIITHHNRRLPPPTTNKENDVVEAQLDVAKFLGLPCINMADNMGINAVNIFDYMIAPGDGYHFAPGSVLYNRYVAYLVAQLKMLNL